MTNPSFDLGLQLRSTHWSSTGRHLGHLSQCPSPECLGIWEQYCRCKTPINVTFRIEDGDVTKVFHPVCEREVDPDTLECVCSENEEFAATLHWEYDSDWETGYVDSYPVLTPPFKIEN
jgi:hypothetical protein